jgi:hypothetical protein
MTENPMLTLVRAYHFAAVRHVEQRRKGGANPGLRWPAGCRLDGTRPTRSARDGRGRQPDARRG